MKHLFSCTVFFCISLFAFSQVAETETDISPILIGEDIDPSLLVYNMEGEPVSLSELLQKKALLIVYRGGWCPYCNSHLGEISKVLEPVKNMGYEIIAISPDNYEKLDKTVRKKDIRYSLYSDKNQKVIKALGLAYYAPKSYVKKLKLAGINLNKRAGGENPENILPVPALFVIEKGVVKFEYISPSVRERISSEMLLAVLRVLAG